MCRKGWQQRMSQVVDVADKVAAKQVDENLRTLGIRNWRQAVTARDVWRRKLAEAKTCIGQISTGCTYSYIFF